MQISARAVPVPHPHTARACASAVLWQTLRHRNFSLYTASRRAAQILFSVLLPWSFILATALFLGQQGIVRQVKSRPTHTCVRLVLRGTFVRCPWRSMRRNPVHLSAVFASAVPASTCAKNLPTAQFWQHLVSHATHESAFLPFPAETLFPSASKRSGEAQVLCKIRRDRARSMLHQT